MLEEPCHRQHALGAQAHRCSRVYAVYLDITHVHAGPPIYYLAYCLFIVLRYTLYALYLCIV